ncbi:MAG TPA: metallophosphoesterase [Dongiaceae bacterium]|nr:metallophosphoesterase [Dongiaceae bacterium]
MSIRPMAIIGKWRGWLAAGMMLLGLLSPLSSFAAGQGNFLVVSDIHFDPLADDSIAGKLATARLDEWKKVFESSLSAGLGSYGQDPAYALVASALDAMRAASAKPDFIIIPGDFLAHGLREKFRASKTITDRSDAAYLRFLEKTMGFMARMFDERFLEAPIILTLGNNDNPRENYDVKPGEPFLALMAKAWQKSVARGGSAGSFESDFPAMGHYDKPHPTVKGGRFVVPNANFMTYGHGKLYPAKKGGDRPGKDELAWLEKTLEMARKNGERVWLVYHEPNGADERRSVASGCAKGPVPIWQKKFDTAFIALLKKYATTVEVIFAGHTHRDEFRLISDGGTPFAAIHVAPSVGPSSNSNPAFKLYTYQTVSGDILDSTTYVLANLETAKNAGEANWSREYDFAQAYGTPPTLAGFALVYARLGSDPETRKTYRSFFGAGSAKNKFITDATWEAFRCGIGHADMDAYQACRCGR